MHTKNTHPHTYPLSSQDSLHADSTHSQNKSSRRVTQTSMVYIVGLPKDIAKQDILAGDAYCGQYGTVLKVVIKESFGYKCENYCSYITFSTEEAASLAVIALTDFYMHGYKISASYGTTKYCSSFLRHGMCRKTECLFHHKIEPGKEIHNEDNRKVFNDQQKLAREFIFKNYQQMSLDHEGTESVFPSKSQVKRRLTEEGIIPQASRFNSFRKKISDNSTQCSPDSRREESLLAKRMKKATYRKKSFFEFAATESPPEEYQNVSDHLWSYLEDIVV